MSGTPDSDEEGGSWPFLSALFKTSIFDDLWGIGYGLAGSVNGRRDGCNMGHSSPNWPNILHQENRREVPKKAKSLS